MSVPNLEQIAATIREIRPDLAETSIEASSNVVNDLGMDSLDMIQLASVLRKQHRAQLDFENWPYQREPLSSIVEHLTPLT